MGYDRLNEKTLLAVNEGEGLLLSDAQSALDLIANTWGVGECSALVIMKRDIDERFFDLSTRLAGEALQKFVNYNMKVAIVGDFSGYTSKSLRDFIRECNNGGSVFFVDTVLQAVDMLGG